MDEQEARNLLAQLDEPTRQRLANAKRDPAGNSRLACDAVPDDVPCTDYLYHCYRCHQLGCWRAGCSGRLFDRDNVCLRCGACAGMNRMVKLSSVWLFQAWLRYHAPSQ